MRLSELTEGSQFIILNEINRELRDLKRGTYWHEQYRSEGASNMFRWFQGFIKFRRSVLDNCDIDDSLSQWVGCSISTEPSALFGKMNVPQHRFYEIYSKAVGLSKELAGEL